MKILLVLQRNVINSEYFSSFYFYNKIQLTELLKINKSQRFDLKDDNKLNIFS